MQIFKDKKNTIHMTLIELCKFYSQSLVFKHLVSNCHNCNKFQYKGNENISEKCCIIIIANVSIIANVF